MLTAKEIDAFAGNRQRQVSLMNAMPGTRVLPDSMIRIPQTIIVPKGKLEALAAVNRFLDDIRASGFLRDSIAKNGVIGVDVALGGSWQPSAP
jgi:ABC-type amino acid transport substrate-binding protein